LEGFGREVRGGNILIFICLVQFFEMDGREGEGSKTPHNTTFCIPPNWGDLEGKGG
jgi:hypothetical protein